MQVKNLSTIEYVMNCELKNYLNGFDPTTRWNNLI